MQNKEIYTYIMRAIYIYIYIIIEVHVVFFICMHLGVVTSSQQLPQQSQPRNKRIEAKKKHPSSSASLRMGRDLVGDLHSKPLSSST